MLEYNSSTNVIHVSWKDIDKVRLPDEILESFARFLVPEFQQYIRDKRAKEKQAEQDKHNE